MRRRGGFTLVELLITIAILGILLAIVLAYLTPKVVIIKAKDAARAYESGQVSKALTQLEISGKNLKTIDRFPVIPGPSRALPICKQGMVRDSGCVNLDILVTTGIIASLPSDSDEPCPSYTGYEVYSTNTQPMIIATQQGKTKGDTLVNRCKLDTLAPDIQNVQSSLFAATATITWDTDEVADSQVEYGFTTSYGNLGSINPVAQTMHSEIITGLLSNSTYHYRVLSRDPSGNLNRSGDYTFVTGDTLPPQFLELPTAVVTEHTATITWTTDENSDTQIYYGLDLPYTLNTSLVDTGNNMVKVHTQTITGLPYDTTYHYNVRSRDASGNLAQSADYTFTTLPDLTPPVVSGISTFVAGTTLTVSWTTDENSDGLVKYGTTAAYGSSVSDPNPTLGTSHSVTITGLTPNTLYHFRIESADNVGNIGTSGNQTVSMTDVTKPTISAIGVSNITHNAARITWTTDEKANSQVEYGLTTSYGTTSALADLSPNDVTSHIVDLTGLGYSKTYHYRIYSTDAAGNQQVTGDKTFDTLNNISNVTITGLTDKAATVNWDTAIAADTWVQYGVSPLYNQNSSFDSTLRTTGHSRNLTNLAASTLYTYRIVSSTAAPVTTAYYYGSFTTGPDVTPPSITGVAVSGLRTTTPTLTWNTNAELSSSQVEYGVTNQYGSWTPLIDTNPMKAAGHSVTFPTLIMNQTYYYRIHSKDAAGNELPVTGSFKTDDIPPVLTIPATPATGITGNAATISWTVNESSQASVTYWIAPNGTPSTTALSGFSSPGQSRSLAGLTPATTYFYTVTSRDIAGNSTTSNVLTFTTVGDITPPVITNVAFTNLNTPTPGITWTTNEVANSQVSYGVTVGYGSNTPATPTSTYELAPHALTFPTLTMNQLYYYRINSADPAGNVGYYAGTFRTDDILPVLTLPPTITNRLATSAVANWTSSEISTARVVYWRTGQAQQDTGYGGAAGTPQSRTMCCLTANNTYNYQVYSRDIAGNVSATTPIYTFSTDVTAPTISSVAVSNIGNTTATITWTTNEAADSQVDYGLTTAYGTSSALSDTSPMVTSHSVTLTGLTTNTQYQFQVKSRDAATNLQVSTNASFTTIDTIPPSYSGITATAVSDTAFTITWDTDESSTSQVEYGLTTSYGTTTSLADVGGVMSHSVDLTGLSQTTTYHFRVRSRDALGNMVPSADGTFTTADITAPNISAILASNITIGAATITWTTDEPADTQVEYGLTTSYGSTSTLKDTGTKVTSHNQVISGLARNTLYHYRVLSRDAAGNLATSGDKTFTTSNDSTPPVITGVGSTTHTNTLTVDIAWTTDEVATTQVEYGTTTGYGTLTTLKDTNPLVIGHSETLTGIVPNTLYHYRVRSKDGASNETLSNNYTFTIIDNTPPVITAGPTVPSVTATTATIIWTTDEIATTQIEYGPTISYDFFVVDATLMTDHSYVLTGLAQDALYHYRVKSRDAAGNSVYSNDFTFSTDGTPPVVSGVTVTNVDNTHVTVQWTTNEPATSKVDYGLTSGYGASTANNTTLVTSHSRDITGLTPNTQYHYRIVTTDGAQNTRNTTDATFVTLP